MKRLNILFAVHDWGLGHATRDLILLRALLAAGHRITVLSNGRALQLLRQELAAACEFIALKDMPKPLSRRAFWFYVKMSLALPWVFHTFHRERQLVQQLCRTRHFDRIVSDTRYGVCSEEIPSYYLVHSLRQIIPGRPKNLERMVERSQRRLLRNGCKILIPDQLKDGLAGDLCHRLACTWGDRLAYIGILSSLQRVPCQPDIDVFISVSGAEPQRSIFERLVLSQTSKLKGKVIVTLGRPEAPGMVTLNGHVTVYGYLNRAQQQGMMNRARLIVSRSGYTTLMELAALGKKALLVPTVGQSEQEYLAAHHRRMGHVHAIHQSKLDLERDVAVAHSCRGLPAVQPTSSSVERFIRIVTG